ncbi:MAG: Lar family restriction alleviation protein [Bacteroidetes bacterium]|nr:Lar family restriction alleviation protein [Bacteroidota bacterium]
MDLQKVTAEHSQSKQTSIDCCPFCRKRPSVFRTDDYAFIRCANDECEIRPSTPIYQGEDRMVKAIATWNWRKAKHAA